MPGARPMTPFCVTFALLLLAIAVMVAAGCAGEQSGVSKSVGNVPPTVIKETPIQPSIQIESPQAPEDGYWIKIDPISDKQVGDIFTVNSTTNLPAGEETLVQVYNSRIVRDISGTSGSVKVVQGAGEMNMTSFVVNTSDFRPDEYVVTEEDIRHNTSGVIIFNVFPAPVSLTNASLKSKNFIDWQKLNLPPLRVNNSMRPENPSFDKTYSELCQITNGSIMLFSTDSIVRTFDENGKQIVACNDFRNFHSLGIPSGSVINIGGNVTTVFIGNKRMVTLIHEAGN